MKTGKLLFSETPKMIPFKPLDLALLLLTQI